MMSAQRNKPLEDSARKDAPMNREQRRALRYGGSQEGLVYMPRAGNLAAQVASSRRQPTRRGRVAR